MSTCQIIISTCQKIKSTDQKINMLLLFVMIFFLAKVKIINLQVNITSVGRNMANNFSFNSEDIPLKIQIQIEKLKKVGLQPRTKKLFSLQRNIYIFN